MLSSARDHARPRPHTPTAATKWIHTLPFRPQLLGNDPAEDRIFPEECKDATPECAKWAEAGERAGCTSVSNGGAWA